MSPICALPGPAYEGIGALLDQPYKGARAFLCWELLNQAYEGTGVLLREAQEGAGAFMAFMRQAYQASRPSYD